MAVGVGACVHASMYCVQSAAVFQVGWDASEQARGKGSTKG
jgi:hypothetical protein